MYRYHKACNKTNKHIAIQQIKHTTHITHTSNNKKAWRTLDHDADVLALALSAEGPQGECKLS